ncbi:hypothetical protein OT109_02535 [Phycisphaeraceae bacterium D3-23]
MNKAEAVFELGELSVHIEDVIAEIKAGRYDEDGDLSYEVAVAHLMDHLVRAWHYAHMTDEKIAGITEDDFDKITCAIPLLQFEYRLVDPYTEIV